MPKLLLMYASEAPVDAGVAAALGAGGNICLVVNAAPTLAAAADAGVAAGETAAAGDSAFADWGTGAAAARAGPGDRTWAGVGAWAVVSVAAIGKDSAAAGPGRLRDPGCKLTSFLVRSVPDGSEPGLCSKTNCLAAKHLPVTAQSIACIACTSNCTQHSMHCLLSSVSFCRTGQASKRGTARCSGC